MELIEFIKNTEGFKQLYELWHTNTDLNVWLVLLISLFCLVCNGGIFAALWYMRKSIIIECGYPKRKEKYISRLWKKYSFFDKLFLFSLVFEAENSCMILLLQFFCNLLNVLAMAASVVGTVASVITHIHGWCGMLMISPVLLTMLVTVAIEFIPDLICVPSERRRYKWK